MTDRRRRRPWRYLVYAAGVFLLLAALLAIGSWLAVRAWGPMLARERVDAALTAALGRPVHVGDVAIEPWRGRLVVRDVVADALPGEPGPHFFTLGRAEVHVGVSSLWRRRLVLRTIRFDGLDLTLGAGPGGGQVLELPILPDVVDTGWVEVELGTLELRQGRLVYTDAARGARMEVLGATITARPGREATTATIDAAEVRLEVAGLREHIERLEGDVRITPTRVEAKRLALTWEKRRITGAGRVDGPFDKPRLDLTARGDIELGALGRRLASAWTLAGMAKVNARVEGVPEKLRVTATVAIDDLTAGPVKARSVAAKLALADGTLSVTELSARAFDGSITGSAAVELARLENTQVKLRLQDIGSPALERLVRLETGVTGRLDADVEARGDLRDPARLQGHLRLGARDVRLPDRLAGLGPGTITAEGRADRGMFDVTRGVAEWPGLRLDVEGQAEIGGARALSLKAAVELRQLAPLLEGTRVAGEATLEATLTGHWRDPRLTGRLDVRSPLIADYRADHVAASFALTQRSLRLDPATVRLGQGRLTATGTLSWPGSATLEVPPARVVSVDLVARTQEMRLEDVAALLPQAARGSGAVAVTAKLDGTLSAWRAAGQAESASLRLASVPPVSDVRVGFEVTPERLDVRSLRARMLDAPLTAKGHWRWVGTGEVEGDAGPLDLARLPDLPEGLSIAGRAQARVKAAMQQDRVSGSARLSADQLTVAGFTLGRGVADVSADGVAVRGEVAFPEARVAATGQGRLDGAVVIATRVTATDVELEPLLRQYRPDLVGTFSGRLSAVATLDVPARDPRATRGLIQLEPVSIEAGGERWEGRGPILVRREPGRVTVERLELTGRLGAASGTGRVEDSGTLEGTLRGQVPLALLSALRPEIREASGRLDVDLRIGGTTAKPILLGRGTIAGGLVAVRDTAVVIRDMEGSLALSPGRLRVEELKASVGMGTVRATGEIGLDGRALGAYQLTISGRGLGATAVEGLETVWNADLAVVGRGSRGVVRGEAHLVRGSYTRDLSIVPMLLKSGPRDEPIEWGREVALQINLHLDDNLVVRSPQAQIRAGGRLLLQGTVAHPVILGTIETQDGRITFRRNRFVLENAVVRFDDPRRPNPYLDVRATTRIRTYDITMWLRGRADDLTIRLSSEPPLPQEDLLALVTLGATRAELGSSGALTFAGEAAQLLSRDLLGLDPNTPFVDILEFGRSEQGQNQFRVGKRLDDQTTVIYSGSFAEGGKQKLRIEYQVIGPLLLAGEQVFSGGVGGDVILRFRFR
jgi:autotransporter translocation and assembly factor TamB